VGRFIVIGFNPERWESGRQLAGRTEGMYLAVGLHPTEADDYDPDLERRLKRTAKESGVVAIGETGIDYHWKTSSPDRQRDAFRRQIDIAKELDLPFIVHQRDAEADVLQVLASSNPPHHGVMHCFTGDEEYASACIDLGLHLGIGGAVTYRSAAPLHRAAAIAPIESIVLETDAPYMAPTPHRGKRNEPAYLRRIVERLAELRGEAADEVAERTTENAIRLFRLDGVPSRVDG
jgi:TatD DNase family protein